MIFRRIKSTIIERGFLLTLVLALTFLFWGYGRLLEYPNSKYFGADGDGLQAYYGAVYHVKHDSTYWRSYGMNHPYGEQVFFTGGQPFVANTIKLISTVVDISDYTVAILNLIMLFSIVFSALCIYLIFKHLKIYWLYAALAAVAIAYLSPQIERLGGHYSLTYQFAVPLFILGLLKFDEHSSVKRSVAIGLLCFFIAGTHFYFFAFYALLSGFYWARLFFTELNMKRIKFICLHFSIQMLIPFLLIQGLVAMIDDVTDRTVFPAGFLTYVSNFDGVFFPPQCDYAYLFEWFWKPVFPEWEGRAYIGVVAVFIMIGIAGLVLRNFLNREYRKMFEVVDDAVLNIFFWASFVGLILSFGYPFIGEGKQTWLEYAGPLKQFRGIGRFGWPFFYMINIIAFYKIYQWSQEKGKGLRFLLLTGTIYLVSYDAWINNMDKELRFNNPIPELNDRSNQLEENKWLGQIKTENYQAIITLPYFHVGSENVWLHTESAIIRDAYVASIKTGLPMSSVLLSRVSLGQTYKNIAIIKEPYRKLEYLKDLKNRKPFLVLVRENDLNDDERKFLSLCKKIQASPRFQIYELNVEALETISDGLYLAAKQRLEGRKGFSHGEFLSTDSLNTFVSKGFEDSVRTACFEGKGCHEGPLLAYNDLFFDTVPNWKDEEYTVSFWMDRFTTDIYPRAVIEVVCFDASGKAYGGNWLNAGERLRLVDGTWALIEAKFRLRDKADKVKITVWTDNYLNEKMLFRADELLIRPLSTNVYKNITLDRITENNRTYLAKQKEHP